MVFDVDNIDGFPDPRLGEPDGLFAVGGDLSLDRLKLAYCYGIFPWYDFKINERIMWYCPMTRFVIDPAELHVSHSLRNLLNKGVYTSTIDRAFDDVIHACSTVNGRYEQEGAWLGPDIIKVFKQLNKERIAHSIEVWRDNKLVGGLYGVWTRHCFIGDSMFSYEPSGSKLALYALCKYMRYCNVPMIDCQLETPHLKSMGGRKISYDTYMDIMQGKLSYVPHDEEENAAVH